MRWEEDVSKLTALHARLKAAQTELEKENRLLARQNQIQGRLLSLRWQNRLCAEVEDQMRSHIEAARSLLATIPGATQREYNAGVKDTLARLGVLICVIKRKSHLFLKGRQAAVISLAELTQAALETFRCARTAGVFGTYSCEDSADVAAVSMLIAYDLCARLVESCLEPRAPLFVRVAVAADRLVLRALIGLETDSPALPPLPSELIDKINELGGTETTEQDEDGLHVVCSLPLSVALPASREECEPV